MDKLYCVMLTTSGSQAEADRLAELLVSSRLAACVQISAIHSWYAWQGKVSHEPEYLLFIKTTADLYPDVEAALLANHSYEIPEIIQIPITRGLDLYLGWIGENTRK
jgi:periplasmic divalent cation tolerance protein